MSITAPLPDHVLRLMRLEDRRALGKAGMTAAEAAAKQIARSERDLQGMIANWFLLHGYWFARQRMDRKATGTLGQPDFLLAVNGCPLALEVKFGAGKLRPEQERAADAMRANGWAVFTIRSLDEVRQIVERIGASKAISAIGESDTHGCQTSYGAPSPPSPSMPSALPPIAPPG